VELEIPSLSTQQLNVLIAEMAALLRDPQNCAEHAWHAGDVLIADNHALLHGRKAFVDATRRHIRRVNIL
jgi:alpha-ketoglutarate-dependent taurine dioxygenase